LNKAFSDKDNNTHDIIAVARVIKAHGLRGEVILAPYRGLEESFTDYSTFWLIIDGIKRLAEITSMRPHKGRYIAKFREIDRVEDTGKLIGSELFVDISILDKKTLEWLFLSKPRDVRVFDENDKYLGILKGILETGAHPVFVILKEDGKELLIPGVEQFIVKVDVAGNRVILSPPEGIYEINDF
jgi:16S rRNA processing protein RimM